MNGPRRSRRAGRPATAGAGSTRVGVLLAAGVLLLLPGCALLPQLGEPEVVGPPPQEPVADSTRIVLPDPSTWNQVEASPPEAPPRTAPEPGTKPVEKVPAQATETDTTVTVSDPAPMDSTVTQPALTVSPPREQLEQIETETFANLGEANRLLESVDSDKLDEAGKTKLRTVKGMITQARDALARQDVQAAAGLARKARLLALELSSR